MLTCKTCLQSNLMINNQTVLYNFVNLDFDLHNGNTYSDSKVTGIKNISRKTRQGNPAKGAKYIFYGLCVYLILCGLCVNLDSKDRI
jgi:hypothetical protein